MQKTIVPHLHQFPRERPLARLDLSKARLPEGFRAEYPPVDFERTDELIASLPIDQDVHRVDLRGGADAAHQQLRLFLDKKLDVYGENRNHPDTDPSSGLSPYLHFGHLSAHTIVRQIFKKCNWTPDLAAPKSNGSRNGWWGIAESPEAFLDQIVTWREIGHVFAYQRPDHAEYASLPDWARKTLDGHRGDPRPYLYTPEEFENATTHDDIWNAAQRQLVRDGVMHNYLRMLWAKKILHWTKSPEEALEIIIDLNNKYALDGRDPNSYSGIFWTLGRFDRAWGPERPIFGKIRYMTSDSTRRKLKLKNYLEEFGASKQASLL